MNKLVKIALDHLGLDSQGKKNLVDFYNAECLGLVPANKRYEMVYGDSWCAMFTSVVARKAGLGKNEFPYGVSVAEQVKQAKRWGIYNEELDGLKVGDLLVFDWLDDGSLDHVGIVQTVKPDLIVTIEGNYSNTVKERFINPNAKFLRGYISLGGVYSEAPKRRLEILAEQVLMGELGNGEERKRLLGDDYGEVQRIVNRLMGV